MSKTNYSSEIKWAVVKDKMTDELTNKEIIVSPKYKKAHLFGTHDEWPSI
ncbi:hypothetical protein [Solibacillus sp. FSL H8-0538]